MRRVKEFFTYQSKLWSKRAAVTFPTFNNTRSPENLHLPGGISEQAAVDEGRRAYAHRQVTASFIVNYLNGTDGLFSRLLFAMKCESFAR